MSLERRSYTFTVLLSYRAIRVFLVQTFSCPVATHGHEPIYIYTRTCVYMIIWRCSETYLWIYGRIKEIDIVEFFLPI